MFEPGPLSIEALPLGPRVVDDGTFGALRVELGEALSGADDALSTIGGVVADPLPVDLDAEFVTTIGVAEQVLSDEPDEGSLSPAADAAGAGDQVEGLRLEVTSHLPPADAPIDLPQDDPPSPPGGGTQNPYGDLPPLDPYTGCPAGWIAVDRDTCADPDDPSRLVPRQSTA